MYTLNRSKWVKLGNLEYRPGSIIFLGFDGLKPTFGVVNEIISIHSTPILKVLKYVTKGLCEVYRSYIISETEEASLLCLYDLPDYSIMHVHHSFAQDDHSSYVCLKWNMEP